MSDVPKPLPIDDSHDLVENKLLLLYLVDRMEIPINAQQISNFILGEEMMSYFSLQQCLAEMVSSALLERSQTDSITSYTITDEGLNSLAFFVKQIPIQNRNKINKFVFDTMQTIKQDYDVTSNFFYNHESDEFIVKCGVYDNETTLLEVNLSVVTKEQAKMICYNWKKNINNIYLDVLQLLTTIETDQTSAQDKTNKN